MCYSVSLYDLLFLSYMPFWYKYSEWPPNNIEHCNVKSTPYMCYWHSESQTSLRFPLWEAVLEIQAILRQVHWINDPIFLGSLIVWSQMTLNTTRSNVTHMCYYSVHKSQILYSVSLFDQPFWRYELHLILNDEKYPVYTKCLPPLEGAFLARFALWPVVEDITLPKIANALCISGRC